MIENSVSRLSYENSSVSVDYESRPLYGVVLVNFICFVALPWFDCCYFDVCFC